MTLAFWLMLALPGPASVPADVSADVSGALAAGNVYHYHSGVFAQVARYRGMVLDWTADGFASVPVCRYVNARRPWDVLARIGGRRLRLQIVDCSDPRDRAHQRALGLVLEVDWTTARGLGFAAYGGGGSGHARAQIWGYVQP